MLILSQILTEHFVNHLQQVYLLTCGEREKAAVYTAAGAARLSMNILFNTDALYHNAEHTMHVTSVALEILLGRQYQEGNVTPRDWLHFVLAALFHDIGYVKGICRLDKDGNYATGIGDEVVQISPLGSDITLAPYHVDRSKLFIRERFGSRTIDDSVSIDTETICSYIEMTRYPPLEHSLKECFDDYASLLRAADFIGQLGDPNYLNKTVALYYEYDELGMNTQLGYHAPGELRKNFAKFYWEEVSPYIQPALRYLRLTPDGKQWIANLHSHVFDVEHEVL